MGKNKKSNSISKANKEINEANGSKLLERIKPIVKENDRISEQFLLRNYDTVFSSSVQLLKTISNLQFTYRDFEYSSNFLVDADFSTTYSNELNFLEIWVLIFNPDFPLASINQGKLQVPLDFLPIFNIWSNSWSYIFTIICKINENESLIKNSQPSNLGESLASLSVPFSNEFKLLCNTKFDSLQKDLYSVWDCLVSIHGGCTSAIPSELILGLMLITTKQDNFLLAEHIATSWIKAIPSPWKKRLAEVSSSMDHSPLPDISAEPAQPLQKFYSHYESIFNLLATHVSVALHSTSKFLDLLNHDEVITPTQKQVLSDRHHVSVKDALIIPGKQSESNGQVLQRAEVLTDLNSQSATNVLNQSSNVTLFDKVTAWFKTSPYTLSQYAIPSAIAVALLFYYFTNRKLTRNNNTSSWWKAWIYRLISSLRMALPNNSGGPNSI